MCRFAGRIKQESPRLCPHKTRGLQLCILTVAFLNTTVGEDDREDLDDEKRKDSLKSAWEGLAELSASFSWGMTREKKTP